MRYVMVRYSVKPDQVANNEALVRAVYDELDGTDSDGFRYATFKLADGVSFVHLAGSETEDAAGTLPRLAAFREFQRGIRERCDEPPLATELSQVGAFHLFAA